MVTPESFRAAHREFRNWTTPEDEAELQRHIANATAVLDATVIPAAQYDFAVDWQAYCYVAVSPYARDKRVSVTEDMLAGARACLGDIIRGAGRCYRVLP